MLKQEEETNKSKNKIAIIVASGNIVDGRQPAGMIGGDSTAEIIRKAHEDESVKATKQNSIDSNVEGIESEKQDLTQSLNINFIPELIIGNLNSYLFKEGISVLNVNIGTGKGTSILELIKTFEDANNVKINHIFGKEREGDAPITIADNSLALSTLNLKPNRSIQDMCIDSWNWTCKNPEGYY